MAIFISVILYRYQQKQNLYYRDIESLKAKHENILLQSQLEIQEQTFQNISREIHDNIGQKLTLAKLHLNTLDHQDLGKTKIRVNDVVEMISEAIKDLSDISRSMSSEVISNNGLLKALEFEIGQLQKPGIYRIKLTVTGEPVFFNSHSELVLFRIVQEAINNIIKHAEASSIEIHLLYEDDFLTLFITDNGKGFSSNENREQGTGLINMQKRANMLKGECAINSQSGLGTTVNIKIPIA
jgi:signal transduction histidine kinase